MKKLLICLLAVLLCLGCFTGCKPASNPGQTETPKPIARTVSVDLSGAVNLGFPAFENGLIEFLKQTDLGKDNCTVSPLSYKAALTLAALGAEGETRTQLLKALGYGSVEELKTWYAGVLAGVDAFDAYFDSESLEDRGQAAYQVVNSVWANESLPGEFQQSYIRDAADTCRAEVCSAPGNELAPKINEWVNEKTRGLIPMLLQDASDSSSVLVNALYLKAGWEGSFIGIGKDAFAARSGQQTEKTYMQQTDDFRYYRDEKTQLVAIPLQGGITMLFVLGDETDLTRKLAQAESKLVEVTVPMFDVETTLSQGELCDYLVALGCDRMFTDQAEFGPMFTEQLFVGDIVQKAKVHIDEEGLEAAAATAMGLAACAMPEEEPEPEIFRADRPFSFYIVNGFETPELLFWGQIVN